MFYESDLAVLRADFPDCDVDLIASKISSMRQEEIKSPLALLRSWINRAEANGTERRNTAARPAIEPESYRSAPLGFRSDPTYGRFRSWIVERINKDRLTPAQVADELEKYRDRFADLPGVNVMLIREIQILREHPEDWPGAHAAIVFEFTPQRA